MILLSVRFRSIGLHTPLTGSSYHYDKRRRHVTLVNDYDGEPRVTHLTDLATAPKHSTDIGDSFNHPVIVVAALTFETPESKLPIIGKLAVQPIMGEGSICPVSNVYELDFLRTVNFVLGHYRKNYPQITSFVSKPLFGLKGNAHLKPSLVLCVKQQNTRQSKRAFIEIIPNALAKTITASTTMIDEIKAHYQGEVLLFEAYKYTDDNKRQYVLDVTTTTKKLLDSMINELKG